MFSDPDVVRFLSNQFVLCWESVRPTATVTIDFGNGQVLKRTLGGNTVMYVCRPDGRVMDALPGVYTPPDFLSQVRETLSAMEEHHRPSAWRAWHRNKMDAAVAAGRIRTTMAKMMVESPLLDALGLRVRGPQLPTDERRAGRVDIANPHAAIAALAAKIEDMSKRPVPTRRLAAQLDGIRARPNATPEETGQQAVALDSRTNVRLVRPAMHLLLSTYDESPTPVELRDVIFRDLLHIPIDDPYLGLVGPLIPGSPK